MHDLLSNSENAAASQDRGGLSGRRGGISFHDQFHPRTPRAACSRGVRVFAAHDAMGRAFWQTPICQPPRRPSLSGWAPHR